MNLESLDFVVLIRTQEELEQYAKVFPTHHWVDVYRPDKRYSLPAFIGNHPSDKSLDFNDGMSAHSSLRDRTPEEVYKLWFTDCKWLPVEFLYNPYEFLDAHPEYLI